MNAGYMFEAIRAHLRARGLSYRDLAATLKLSESAVKKMFSKRDCTLSRLDDVCAVIGVDLSEIARGAPRQKKLIDQLTREQEQEIVDDVRLYIVAVCAMQGIRIEDIVRTYKLTEAQCVAQLTRLDKIGFLDLMPHNRYRLLVAKAFRWIPDGPIMRWCRKHAPDYFNDLFDGPADALRVVNVRLCAESRSKLFTRLELKSAEFSAVLAGSRLAARDPRSTSR
jgi:DNA-binding Xre family transcriptional regulator